VHLVPFVHGSGLYKQSRQGLNNTSRTSM